MIRNTEYSLAIGALLFAVGAAAVSGFDLPSRAQAAPAPFQLTAVDDSGRIRVDWDGGNPDVKTAEAGTLDVQDGGAFQRYELDRRVIKGGGLDYVRKSNDVLLTLTLYRDGRPGTQATVRSIAPGAPDQPQTRARNH